MAEQGSYPLNGRALGPTDTCTGVVTGQTADITLSVLASFILANSPASGPTSQRPNPTFIGQPYFDTTLGFMVWCSQILPAVWVDSAGVSL
jgi:hypothetical protein